MLEPLFFGQSDTRLFGVFHAPATAPTHNTGVILCPPMGQEWIRCHRAFSLLARQFAQAGFPVLRFDYSSTGDSYGDDENAQLSEWSEDVLTAIEEIQGRTGMERICLVGIRLGGALAIRCSIHRPDIDLLVLWDPVLDGSDYVREILESHDEWFRGSFAQKDRCSDPSSIAEVLGFPLTQNLQEEIEAIELSPGGDVRARRILICWSHDTAHAASPASQFRGRLQAEEIVLEEEIHSGASVWRKKSGEGLNEAWVPRTVLQRIVSWVSTSTR